MYSSALSLSLTHSIVVRKPIVSSANNVNQFIPNTNTRVVNGGAWKAWERERAERKDAGWGWPRNWRLHKTLFLEKISEHLTPTWQTFPADAVRSPLWKWRAFREWIEELLSIDCSIDTSFLPTSQFAVAITKTGDGPQNKPDLSGCSKISRHGIPIALLL